MVESTAVSCIHPNNNSVDRIISKEEEREDPRRDKERFFNLSSSTEYSGISTYNPFYKNYKISSNTVYSTVFPHAIQQLQVILHTELILLHKISKKYYNYKAHPMQINTRHLQVTVPVSPSILHGRIKLQAPRE